MVGGEAPHECLPQSWKVENLEIRGVNILDTFVDDRRDLRCFFLACQGDF